MTIVYLEDVLVLAKAAPQMIDRLSSVFNRLRGANLRMHPSKCHWPREKIKFLSHNFDVRGKSVDPDKFEIVKRFPTSNCSVWQITTAGL
jgi:hypothetical protein